MLIYDVLPTNIMWNFSPSCLTGLPAGAIWPANTLRQTSCSLHTRRKIIALLLGFRLHAYIHTLGAYLNNGTWCQLPRNICIHIDVRVSDCSFLLMLKRSQNFTLIFSLSASKIFEYIWSIQICSTWKENTLSLLDRFVCYGKRPWILCCMSSVPVLEEKHTLSITICHNLLSRIQLSSHQSIKCKIQISLRVTIYQFPSLRIHIHHTRNCLYIKYLWRMQIMNSKFSLIQLIASVSGEI